MKKFIFAPILVFLFLAGCKKDDTNPDDQQLIEYSLPIRFNTFLYDKIDSVELIIQDIDYNILKDTILPRNMNHNIKYKSKEEKINLTYISKSSYYDRIIKTYFQIIPCQMEIPLTLDEFYYMGNTRTASEETVSHINFINGPNGYYHLTLTAGFTEYSNSENLEVKYSGHSSDDYLYYVEPESGLYLLTEITKNDTIIDLSVMSPVEETVYTVNSDQQLVFSNSLITAYPDETDFSKYLDVYIGNMEEFDEERFIYPHSGIDKFTTYVSFQDENRNQYTYRNFSDNVPSVIELLSPSYIQVNNSIWSDVSVEFPQNNPSYYSAKFYGDKIIVVHYMPPDINSYNPEAFISTIRNVDFLKNISLTDFIISNITAEKADDLNYQDFFSNVYNPDMTKEKISLSRKITRKL